MEQIEPALFATLKQDAAILKSTRAIYRKGGSSQLYCHESVGCEQQIVLTFNQQIVHTYELRLNFSVGGVR